MTLDEAIKHAEEVVEENSKSYEELLACKNRGNIGWSKSDIESVDKSIEQCKKCAKEHRQLAEWLKELKAHREAWAKLREDIIDEAEFAYADFDEYKYEVLGIDDVDDLPNDDYRYGMERALELIDIYRPKEGENE